jgi:hypothetical protein
MITFSFQCLLWTRSHDVPCGRDKSETFNRGRASVTENVTPYFRNPLPGSSTASQPNIRRMTPRWASQLLDLTHHSYCFHFQVCNLVSRVPKTLSHLTAPRKYDRGTAPSKFVSSKSELFAIRPFAHLRNQSILVT